MKIYKFIIILIFCLINISCFFPKNGSSINLKPNTTDTVLLENFLPKGFVKDGTEDYSKYVQKAVQNYKKVIICNFPILCTQKIIIPSHREIFFLPQSKLIFQDENIVNAYGGLIIRDAVDVTIKNVHITGTSSNKINLSSNKINSGISIYSSKDIIVENGKIVNCAGDGIYIGVSNKETTSSNIFIKEVICDSNFRNGISIISGNNINVINCILSNSYRLLPMAGLDIEPNHSFNEIRDISIINLKTVNNSGKGVQIGLNKLTKLYSNFVEISLINYKDSGSATGIVISCNKKNFKTQIPEKYIGQIKLINPILIDNKEISIKAKAVDEIAPTIIVKNLKILNKYLKVKNIKDYFNSKAKIIVE